MASELQKRLAAQRERAENAGPPPTATTKTQPPAVSVTEPKAAAGPTGGYPKAAGDGPPTSSLKVPGAGLRSASNSKAGDDNAPPAEEGGQSELQKRLAGLRSQKSPARATTEHQSQPEPVVRPKSPPKAEGRQSEPSVGSSAGKWPKVETTAADARPHRGSGVGSVGKWPKVETTAADARPPAATTGSAGKWPKVETGAADAHPPSATVGGKWPKVETAPAAGPKSPRPAEAGAGSLKIPGKDGQASLKSPRQEPPTDTAKSPRGEAAGELAARLAEMRERAAEATMVLPEPKGSEKERLSPALAQEALEAAKKDNAGPPFFNKAFLLRVSETLSSSVGKRFLQEVFETFDHDKDGSLTFAEVAEITAGLYKVLELPPLPQRIIHDLRDRAASAEADKGVSRSFNSLGERGFAAFFNGLMKKATLKIKAEAFVAKSRTGQLRRTRPEVPQECVAMPEGLIVEVFAFKQCYPDYEDGAKKLRLRKFAGGGTERLPPRDGLVVIGSYRHVKESRVGGPKQGAYVVGVRDELSGEEFVIDQLGLRPMEPDEDEMESYLRGRREAAQVGRCLTVRLQIQAMDAVMFKRRQSFAAKAKPALPQPAPKPKRNMLNSAAFAMFQPKAKSPSAGPAPPPPPPAPAAPGAGGSRGSLPVGRVRTGSFPKASEAADWLTEPQWLQAASACLAEEEGCMSFAKGQWFCVQFIGRGPEEGWCYGSDEQGSEGWFPTAVLGDWRPASTKGAT